MTNFVGGTAEGAKGAKVRVEQRNRETEEQRNVELINFE